MLLVHSSLNSWNTSNVTTMQSMFKQASAFNQNLSTWNTGKVTTMLSMFNGASVFNNGDASGLSTKPLTWVTDNVTSMGAMFADAVVFNQSINTSGSYWNTEKVTAMNLMFGGATLFNQPIGGWNTGNVTTMFQLFYKANAFNQPIGGWNTGKVTTMSDMFRTLTTNAFNQNISNWNVSNVTTMSQMFTLATVFNNGQAAGLSDASLNWYAPKCTTFSLMFQQAPAFNQPIPFLVDTSNVLLLPTGCSLAQMFLSATKFNQNISAWNVSRVTLMSSMFNGATVFNNSDPSGSNITTLNNWYAPRCTTFASMFNATSSFNQAIPYLVDASNVTLPTGCSLASMFQNAAVFNQNLNTWNVSRVTSMSQMFYRTTGSTAFNNGRPLGTNDTSLNWYAPMCTTFATMFSGSAVFNQPIPFLVDTSGVATGCTLDSMFSSNTLFNQNISAWNVSRVTLMSSMFNGATAFNNGSLTNNSSNNLNNWNAPLCTTFSQMFQSASAFNQAIPILVDVSCTTLNSMFQNASVFNQNLNTWNVSRVTSMSLMFSGASVFNNGQTGTIDISGNLNTSSALYTNSSRLLTCTGGNFRTLTSADVLIITTTGLVYSSQIQTTPISDVSLVLLTAYGANIPSGITSIKKQVAGTADLSWNTQTVTTTANMFQTATYFNQRLLWNMRLNTNVTSMFAGTATTFINLFNNGQILTETTQPLYPGTGVNMWDFSGNTVTSTNWHANSRLTSGNGITFNPALPF